MVLSREYIDVYIEDIAPKNKKGDIISFHGSDLEGGAVVVGDSAKQSKYH